MSATTMGTTNIFDLEIDKQTVVQQQQHQHQQQQQPPPQQQQNNNYMDPSTINELVNGIEQLRQSGLTSIPTRDIPNHTERNVIDQETLSTYVPQTKRDKAQAQPLNNDDDDDYDVNQGSMKVKSFSIEGVYEDIQMPIFVGILYFMFQLPVFKKYLFYFFPNLIGLDGNYNLAGYSFISILFALLYYLINVAVKHI